MQCGNPDLEPQKSTVLEAIYERRFWGEGVFDVTWLYAEVVPSSYPR